MRFGKGGRKLERHELKVDKPLSIKDLATNQLRRAILDKTLVPGQKYTQEELASMLGVSRMPVREALKTLAAEGLVVIHPRGCTVSEFGEADIREIYLLREILESLAAEQAVPNLDETDLEELEAHIEAMEARVARRDYDRFIELNKTFHWTIYEASGSARLLHMITVVWNGRPVYTPSFLPGQASRSAAEHRAIVEAIKERDGEQVGRLMKEHINNARDAFIAYWNQSEK